jgi:2'-5' RNA ligase
LKKEEKYFIAIIPPSPFYEEALSWKHFFKDHYQSKASLNSPPHITLHMPFLWKEAKEKILIDKLERFTQTYHPIEINLNGFGCFEPRVIFIDVELSEPLGVFHKELQRFCKVNFQLFHAAYRDLPYHPHITLAFRDLKKQIFPKAWEEVKEKSIAGSFQVNNIALLKHNGKTWEVLKEFSFLKL